MAFIFFPNGERRKQDEMCCEENYYNRIDDLQDPEKWWSEQHTKMRIWQQWAIDHLLDELLNAIPSRSTMEIIYDIYVDLDFKSKSCDKNSDQHCMYMYAKKVIFEVSEKIDPDEFYYQYMLKSYMEEEYDYDDEW